MDSHWQYYVPLSWAQRENPPLPQIKALATVNDRRAEVVRLVANKHGLPLKEFKPTQLSRAGLLIVLGNMVNETNADHRTKRRIDKTPFIIEGEARGRIYGKGAAQACYYGFVQHILCFSPQYIARIQEIGLTVAIVGANKESLSERSRRYQWLNAFVREWQKRSKGK